MKGMIKSVAMCVLLVGCASSQIPQPLPLKDTHWVIVELNGEAFESPSGDTAYYLELHRNGTMDAWAGCNVLHGVYQHEGTVLRIGPFAELTRQCSKAEMEEERRVMRALEGASHYVVSADALSLLNPIGIEQARLQARRK